MIIFPLSNEQGWPTLRILQPICFLYLSFAEFFQYIPSYKLANVTAITFQLVTFYLAKCKNCASSREFMRPYLESS